MFFIRMLVCSFISSLIVPVILLIKGLLKDRIPAKRQYHLWYLMLSAFAIPLFPAGLWRIAISFTQTVKGSKTVNYISPVNTAPDGSSGTQLIRDFAVCVNRPDFSLLNFLLGVVWITGLVIMMAAVIHAAFRLRRIRKTAAAVKDYRHRLLFEQCRSRLNIRRSVFLGESLFAKSPMTFSLFRTATILPVQLKTGFSEEEIKHVFLHELNHVKSGDIFVNHLICAFQIIYWFNPLAWIGIRQMKLDREIACDASVLQMLDENGNSDYGHTILNFVDYCSRDSRFVLANELGGSKRDIKKRLEKIASFNKRSNQSKIKGLMAFLITAMFIIFEIPLVSAMDIETGQGHYNFTGKNVSYENLKSYFKGCDGCIVLYDLKADRYNIYNKDKSTTRVSPDSTFKIYSALFGLERHVITPENTEIKWNHAIYPYDSWNANQILSSAMQNSVNWYFQAIDQKCGIQALNGFYKKIGYGNSDLSGGVNCYWQESSLLISPLEQVQILKKFYQNSMGFNLANVNAVKAAIRVSKNDGAIIYGKTGSSVVNGKAGKGWFIGYVEKNKNVIFFATNIQGDVNATGERAAQITFSILATKKIY